MNFPSSPVVDQTYSFGDKTWKWNGVAWKTIPQAYTGPTLVTLGISNHDLFSVDSSGRLIIGTYGEISHDGAKFIFKSSAGPIVLQSGLASAPLTPVHSSTPTFDCSESNVFEPGVLTSNVTSMTLANPSGGQEIKIVFKQDGVGGRTVAGPAGASIAGSMPSSAGSIGILTLLYYSRDSIWIGNWTAV